MSPLISKKWKASTLFYVLAVCLVIGLLLSMFVMFVSFKHLYRENLGIASNLLNNAQSGMSILQTDRQLIPYDDERWVDLFDTGKDSVLLKRRLWGAFDVLSVKAIFHQHREELVALSGTQIPPEEKAALWLADFDRPLSVSGKTLLKGTCYLPKSGIKTAYVEGTSFIGDKPILGQVKNSSSEVPSPDKAWLAYLANVCKGDMDLTTLEPITFDGDSIFRSFRAPTALIEQVGNLQIDGWNIKGNVLIRATKRIKVKASARLKDVMLVAPIIEFEEGFKGSLQAIASDTILLGDKVELAYPSSLVVYKTANKRYTPLLQIGEACKIAGVVLAWQDDMDIRYIGRIVSGKDCRFKGQILGNGFVGLNSCKIEGTVYAAKLLLVTPSSVYENHLLDTEINGDRLPANFNGIAFEGKTYLGGVAKWLY